MKTGFITIAGRPNAGKSTLINALVGEKVAIVSWRPQTTRDKVLGVRNGEDYQMILTDTPGIHEGVTKLSDYMKKTIMSALKDVDVIIYVIDGEHGVTAEDADYISSYSLKAPMVVVVNKSDSITQVTMFKSLERLNDFSAVKAVVPMSAKRGDNLDALVDEVYKLLPDGDPIYPEDMYTDRSMRFMASEIIREKTLLLLDKEIPHGIGVLVNKFELRPSGEIYDIQADIVCEKATHKAIIIGKAGSMLKKIATAARLDLEQMADCKVFLSLFVKVNPDWRDSEYLMKELGYDKKNI